MTDYHRIPEKEVLEHYPQIAPYFHDIDKQKAAHAYYNTSHKPEHRGASLRASYSLDLIRDLANVKESVEAAKKRGAEITDHYETIIENWFTGHRAGLKAKYMDYIHAHSQVASSFICGPANFPVARNKKRSDTADRRNEAISEFSRTSIKRVLKTLLPFGDGTVIKTEDPNATDKIQAKIKSLETQRDQMKKVNAIVRKYFKKGSPDVTQEQREKCCQELQELTGLALPVIEGMLKPNYMDKVVAYESWELTNLGAEIRRLKARTEEVEQVQATEINDEFENGITVEVSDDQKICIHFGYKPEEETRKFLRRYSFKFSRYRNNAWVRKLTANAEADYNNYVKPMIAAL